MERTDRLRTAEALLARARRRSSRQPASGEALFETGRVAGLIEAARLVLDGCENPGCPEHGELGVTP